MTTHDALTRLLDALANDPGLRSETREAALAYLAELNDQREGDREYAAMLASDRD